MGKLARDLYLTGVNFHYEMVWYQSTYIALTNHQTTRFE
jgi:hypothetical protein